MSKELKEQYKDYPTTLPDYKYEKLDLKYLPPPQELQEGQVYMSKREFKTTVTQMYWNYFKQNPIIPLGFASTFGTFVAGVRYSYKGQSNKATQMMYCLCASQAVCLLAFRHAHNKKVKEKEAQLASEGQQYMMDSSYK